jgi:hypothetical protein
MTPQEKAKELFNKMSIQTYSYQLYAGAHYNIDEIGWEAGKKCALIAVDEIINNIPCREEYGLNGFKLIDNTEYWEEVKQEIELL